MGDQHMRGRAHRRRRLYERDTDTGEVSDRQLPALWRSLPDKAIVPLSDNKTALKNSINSYTAAGSTAGHIGIAWAWYLLSPNFRNLLRRQQIASRRA